MQIFELGFMQRAFLGGSLVALSCALIGVFVTLRKEAFISEAVAHASLSGIALGFLLAVKPTILAVMVGMLTVVGITLFQKKTNISSDSVIGIFLSLIFAIGVVILSFVEGYKPELTGFLFGSILGISNFDIMISGLILALVILFFSLFYHQLLYVSFDRVGAKVRGIKVDVFDLVLRLLTALVIVSSIKMIGMILVTALIVLPASTAKLIASSYKSMFPLSALFSLISVVVGLVASYYLDIPSGASIVISSAIILGIVALGEKAS